MNSSEGLYFFSKTFFHVLAGFYDRKVNFDYLNFRVICIETYDMTQLINLFFTTKRSFPSCDFALFIPVLLISQNNINAKVYFFFTRQMFRIYVSNIIMQRRLARLYGISFLVCLGWHKSNGKYCFESVILQKTSVIMLLFFFITIPSRNANLFLSDFTVDLCSEY